MLTYPLPPPQTMSPEGSTADDFLDALLGGSDSSSAPASPLWSPCTTDSGINEDAPTDPRESPHPPFCSAFPALSFPQPPPPENHPPPPHEKASDVAIDLGKRRCKKENYDVEYWHFILGRKHICNLQLQSC